MAGYFGRGRPITGINTYTKTQSDDRFRDSISGDMLPDSDSIRDIGSTSKRWAQGWFDDVTAGTADINGGTIDGTVIGGSTPAAISGTDLTLSGGVYLGGTGAANLLDDYEEGTFTPVLSSSGGGGVNLAGLYTKVGRLITVAVDGFNFSTAGLSAGNLEIAGLPFAPGNANSPSVAYFQIAGATSASNGRALLYLSSGSAGQLYKAESTSAGLNNLTVADLNATVSVRFNGFYYTA